MPTSSTESVQKPKTPSSPTASSGGTSLPPTSTSSMHICQRGVRREWMRVGASGLARAAAGGAAAAAATHRL
eukprot:1309767-Prymnesium_polylepis.1